MRHLNERTRNQKSNFGSPNGSSRGSPTNFDSKLNTHRVSQNGSSMSGAGAFGTRKKSMMDAIPKNRRAFQTRKPGEQNETGEVQLRLSDPEVTN